MLYLDINEKPESPLHASRAAATSASASTPAKAILICRNQIKLIKNFKYKSKVIWEPSGSH